MVELTEIPYEKPIKIYFTEDGKLVMRDVFKFYGTHGLPLEIILWYLASENIVIDWINFMTDALKDGMSARTLRSRILAAVGDVYGAKYREGFEKSLSRFLP